MSVTGHGRLMQVLAAEGIRSTGPVISLPSNSNATWQVGDLIVRVCWSGDITRMEREAQLAAHLPPEVPYPDVVSSGSDGELSWIVTQAVVGSRVEAVWRSLDHNERREVVIQLGEILSALHSWTPPPTLASMLDRNDVAGLADPAVVVGAALNPVPVRRASALAQHAHRLPFVDQRVMDAVHDRLDELASHDPYADDEPMDEPMVVVHGDAHFANMLWRDGRLVAIFDFEWARLGPADLELEPFLRSVNWTGKDPESFARQSMAQVLGWLADAYPEPFAPADLVERLWLYQLAFTVRELYTWPLEGPADQLVPDHPLHHLPLFVASASHIEQVLIHVRR